ncbi:hypothetical protein QBE52_19055 [Clostridiaceae bacterium 35-E11]
MFHDALQEEKYNETFRKVYNTLKYHKEKDEKYTIHQLEALLDSLYVNEGNDWIGRGEIKNAIQAATIAASETLLTEWKNELQNIKNNI